MMGPSSSPFKSFLMKVQVWCVRGPWEFRSRTQPLWARDNPSTFLDLLEANFEHYSFANLPTLDTLDTLETC